MIDRCVLTSEQIIMIGNRITQVVERIGAPADRLCRYLEGHSNSSVLKEFAPLIPGLNLNHIGNLRRELYGNLEKYAQSKPMTKTEELADLRRQFAELRSEVEKQTLAIANLIADVVELKKHDAGIYDDLQEPVLPLGPGPQLATIAGSRRDPQRS